MFLWLLLLILGVLPKAVLLLNPPWSTTFKGQKVILTCKDFGSPAQEATSWYQSGEFWKEDSDVIKIEKSGYYQCKTPGTSLSNPVHVEFSPAKLILQASYPVFEGDNVTLRCRGEVEENASEKVYYKNKKKINDIYNPDSITLNSVFRNNDEYHCTASRKFLLWSSKETSKPLRIQVQELFPQPVLTARPSQPIEGGPVTLICETQLHPQKSDVQLHFRFFREDQLLGPGWSSSQDFQILTVRREDAGMYQCEAKTVYQSITKKSLKSQIRVQSVPVSDVNLEIQPRGGELIEGEDMVLTCSVTKGTGAVTFSWHLEGTMCLGRKTQYSLLAELRVHAVKEHNAGRYYCTADNNHVPILSKWITVTVRIPVSLPVLTLRVSRAQAVVGDVAELHCEALRGSPPILYQFYHDKVALGNSSTSSRGGVSFNLSLTTEHSGNYSCQAGNGLGAQQSQTVSLTVTVPVSRPVLTLRAPETPTVVEGLVELHCEALRGSPPILYQFYHEKVTLGNKSALSGGGASFNIFLTTENSGNYSCDADNGLGAQHSEEVTLNFRGTSRSRIGLVTGGTVGGLLLLISISLATLAALLPRFRTQGKSGGLPIAGTSCDSSNGCQETSRSRPSNIHLQELPNPEPPAIMEPLYNNVHPEENLVYSEVCSLHHMNKNSANSPRTHWPIKESMIIYSELKKSHTDDSAEECSRNGSFHEDATENYENIPNASATLEQ
ncbi:Fc receptor-like protein 3 isoform X2 [Ochotona curzoniae]|uniref:Fc receptor-like protein 3 isoform X2 n=1 Tax=Ochotona curzoniae TaxID=130825 RepID=UPI001B34FC21|nr:Fc receptor-like protein 3 isoform X2 [Ochotona curzoniae]